MKLINDEQYGFRIEIIDEEQPAQRRKKWKELKKSIKV